jgi:hypothetical protein
MPVETTTDWSIIYRALAHDDRRELLRYLGRVSEARIEDVERHLLGQRDDSAGADTDSLRIALYHVHAPKLTAAGLLAWDSRTERMSLTSLGSQLPAEMLSPSAPGLPDTDDREPAVE